MSLLNFNMTRQDRYKIGIDWAIRPQDGSLFLFDREPYSAWDEWLKQHQACIYIILGILGIALNILIANW